MARLILVAACISALAACGGSGCETGEVRCSGNRPQTCAGDTWVDAGPDCSLAGDVCQYCEGSLLCRQTASCVPPADAHCHCTL